MLYIRKYFIYVIKDVFKTISGENTYKLIFNYANRAHFHKYKDEKAGYLHIKTYISEKCFYCYLNKS